MKYAGLTTALTLIWLGFGMSEQAGAMGASPQTLSASCASEGDKTVLPDGFCALFLQRLALAYPDRTVTHQIPGDLRLVVQKLTAGGIIARIDSATGKGEATGMMQRGAPLDQTSLTRFMDGLISDNPLR